MLLFPSTPGETPTPIDSKNESTQLEDSKNKEKIQINMEIRDEKIIIKIKYGIDIYNCINSLNELKEKDNYFKSFEKIEEVFNQIYKCINDNNYSIQKEVNNLVLIIDLLQNGNKHIISFILDKNEITNEDKIKSLYLLINKYIKENNELKEDIYLLKKKIDELNYKFDLMERPFFNYFSKNIESQERKTAIEFDNITQKSNILSNNDVLLLKSWLPFENINNLKCKLLYSANIDGDNVKTYHSLTKYKKDTLTIIFTSDNKKIGAYMSKPLYSIDSNYMCDEKAFLFSFNRNEKYKSMSKFNFTFIRDYREGPIFGDVNHYNIYITDNFLNSCKNYYTYSSKGFDFKKIKDKEKHYFKVIDLEIFQVFE